MKSCHCALPKHNMESRIANVRGSTVHHDTCAFPVALDSFPFKLLKELFNIFCDHVNCSKVSVLSSNKALHNE